jgi:hypothetical protein
MNILSRKYSRNEERNQAYKLNFAVKKIKKSPAVCGGFTALYPLS